MTANTEIKAIELTAATATRLHSLRDQVRDALGRHGKAMTRFLSGKTLEGQAESTMQLVQRAGTALDEIGKRTIKSDDDYSVAAADLLAIKVLQKQLEATRVELVKPIDEAKGLIQVEFKGPAEFLAQAEAVLKGKISAYLDAKDVADREAAARAADKAEATAAKLEERAAILAAEGKDYQAATLLEKASMTTVVIPVSGAPKVAGIASREVWKHEVTDLSALVKAVAAGQVPMAALKADDKFLGNQAKALKVHCKYPGVKVYPDRSIAAGGRR